MRSAIRHGSVWREIADTADPAVRKRVERQIADCPSGRLQYAKSANEPPVEISYPPTVATIPNGALWVLGGVPVETADGFTYEVRNRQLLCRCGASKNKPFCDGSHRRVNSRRRSRRPSGRVGACTRAAMEHIARALNDQLKPRRRGAAEFVTPAINRASSVPAERAAAFVTASMPYSSMKRTDGVEPLPVLRFVNTKGRSPRILRASRILERRADQRRQVDLVDHEQVRLRDAGPALRGILSPAATSIT